eukprot:jgi/Mesvir1/10822/Mv07750-RA.1
MVCLSVKWIRESMSTRLVLIPRPSRLLSCRTHALPCPPASTGVCPVAHTRPRPPDLGAWPHLLVTTVAFMRHGWLQLCSGYRAAFGCLMWMLVCAGHILIPACPWWNCTVRICMRAGGASFPHPFPPHAAFPPRQFFYFLLDLGVPDATLDSYADAAGLPHPVVEECRVFLLADQWPASTTAAAGTRAGKGIRSAHGLPDGDAPSHPYDSRQLDGNGGFSRLLTCFHPPPLLKLPKALALQGRADLALILLWGPHRGGAGSEWGLTPGDAATPGPVNLGQMAGSGALPGWSEGTADLDEAVAGMEVRLLMAGDGGAVTADRASWFGDAMETDASDRAAMGGEGRSAAASPQGCHGSAPPLWLIDGFLFQRACCQMAPPESLGVLRRALLSRLVAQCRRRDVVQWLLALPLSADEDEVVVGMLEEEAGRGAQAVTASLAAGARKAARLLIGYHVQRCHYAEAITAFERYREMLQRPLEGRVSGDRELQQEVAAQDVLIAIVEACMDILPRSQRLPHLRPQPLALAVVGAPSGAPGGSAGGAQSTAGASVPSQLAGDAFGEASGARQPPPASLGVSLSLPSASGWTHMPGLDRGRAGGGTMSAQDPGPSPSSSSAVAWQPNALYSTPQATRPPGAGRAGNGAVPAAAAATSANSSFLGRRLDFSAAEEDEGFQGFGLPQAQPGVMGGASPSWSLGTDMGGPNGSRLFDSPSVDMAPSLQVPWPPAQGAGARLGGNVGGYAGGPAARPPSSPGFGLFGGSGSPASQSSLGSPLLPVGGAAAWSRPEVGSTEARGVGLFGAGGGGGGRALDEPGRGRGVRSGRWGVPDRDWAGLGGQALELVALFSWQRRPFWSGRTCHAR